MGTKRRTALVAATAAALACTLTACGSDDPQPQFAPPASTGNTPTASTTSGSPHPEPWQIKSDDGAVAFVKHWLDALNQAQAGNGTDNLRSVSSSACETCRRFADSVDDTYDSGGVIINGEWSLESSSLAPAVPLAEARVDTQIRQEKESLRATGASPAKHFPGGLINYRFDLQWDSDHWEVNELAIIR